MEDVSHQYLLFNLEETFLGFPLRCIKLVLRAAEPMRVPHVPGGPLGLLDLHGEMLPVYDLRALMRMSPAGIQPEHHFIVASPGGTKEIYLVDDIDEVVDLSGYHFERPSGASMPALVAGMVRYNKQVVLCLGEDELARRSRPEIRPG